MARASLGLVCALVLGMLGCNATSTSMVRTSHFAILGARDAATVVFVRPSSYKGEITATITDARGRFLGDSLAESYFVVRVPPGENVFISCTENTSALRATLAPGKIYFVEVASKYALFGARIHLLAIGPTSRAWRNLDTWMTESVAYATDEPAGQAVLAARPRGMLADCIARGEDRLRAYSAEELDARTLGPGDGR